MNATRAGRLGFVATAALAMAACNRGPSARFEGLHLALGQTSLTLGAPGNRARLNANAVDDRRRPVATATIRWWSSDTSVVSVDDHGLVTGNRDGVARVWASVGLDSGFTVIVVERPPEPLAFVMLPDTVRFDALGASATLQARQVAGDTVQLAPACASDNPGVVIVRPDGRVGSRGNGTTTVRCRVGTVESTVAVEVKQRVARVGIVADGPLQPNDTLRLMLTKVDRLGRNVVRGSPTWVSLDPAVVLVDSTSGVTLALSTGTARVTAEVGGVRDTVAIQVLEPPPPFALEQLVGRPARAVPRPSAPASRRALAASSIPTRNALDEDGIIQRQVVGQGAPSAPIALGSALTVSAVALEAEHLVDLGFGPERTAGLMYGGDIDWQIAQRFLFRALAATGRLAADSAGVHDRNVAQALVDLRITALSWLAFRIGGGRLVYQELTPGGAAFGSREGWWLVRSGAEASFDLANGAIRTVVRGSLLPLLSVQNATFNPNLGFGGGAGVEYHHGLFSASLNYDLERYTFPSAARRSEQLATLRLGIGLFLGGR